MPTVRYGAMQLGDKPGSCQEDPKQRSIVVQITDQCPECGPNHLDIQALTWAKVSTMKLLIVSGLASALPCSRPISSGGGVSWCCATSLCRWLLELWASGVPGNYSKQV